VGVWGWGSGGLAPTPTPQSPIPNPQSPFYMNIYFSIILINNKKYKE